MERTCTGTVMGPSACVAPFTAKAMPPIGTVTATARASPASNRISLGLANPLRPRTGDDA
jgi:hypothetical protein